MDKFVSTIADWFNHWPDFVTSPPVIFIVGLINSYTSIVLAIPSTLAIAQVFRMRTRFFTFKMWTNVLVSLLLATAVIWSVFSYFQNDKVTAIKVGVGAVILSALIKGIPWLWFRFSKHKKDG